MILHLIYRKYKKRSKKLTLFASPHILKAKKCVKCGIYG